MRTCIKAWLSSNFGQIVPLVSMATDSVKKRCCHFFSVVVDGILFILLGNDNIHKSLDGFEIRPDPTMTTELAALNTVELLANKHFNIA